MKTQILSLIVRIHRIGQVNFVLNNVKKLSKTKIFFLMLFQKRFSDF